jgi:hypothetical protein
MKIWKYQLTIFNGEQTIEMPPYSKILSVNIQNNGIFLWAIIEKPETNFQKRRILVLGTGIENKYSSHHLCFIGTVMDTPLVWHVFEVLDDNYSRVFHRVERDTIVEVEQ